MGGPGHLCSPGDEEQDPAGHPSGQLGLLCLLHTYRGYVQEGNCLKLKKLSITALTTAGSLQSPKQGWSGGGVGFEPEGCGPGGGGTSQEPMQEFTKEKQKGLESLGEGEVGLAAPAG